MNEPPIRDPYLYPNAPPPRARTPLGLVIAIVGATLFLVAAGIAFWSWRALTAKGPPPEVAEPSPVVPLHPPVAPSPPPPAVPSASAQAPAPTATASALAPGVPSETREAQRGAITVVDLGVRSSRSLKDELAMQRASAQAEGRTVVLMTTQYGSKLLLDFDAALPDPRMQKALAKVRLVRVDSRYFLAELDEMGVPTATFPWFVLLGADLSPRDGVSGGEWDDDIARNIAPVLGAFVSGTYRVRREPWTPPRGKGVEL